MKNFLSAGLKVLPIILLFSAFTLVIFSQVLSGFTLSNGNLLYAFEPWIYYAQPGQGDYNHVLSDSIDWPNIYYHIEQIRRGELPLWGFNEQLGKPGIFLMNNMLVDPLRLILWVSFGVPVGLTIEILIKFMLGGVFSYFFLRQLKVEKFIAIACSTGYIFGSSQIASYLDAFAFAALLLPGILFFFEKVLERDSWSWTLALTVSFYMLASYAAAHVVFFSVFWILTYVFLRICFLKTARISLLLKIAVAGLSAITCFAAFLLPTIEYFRNGINLGYREGYGVSQGISRSLFNMFYSNIYGHPLLDAERWKFGTYVNIGVFVGFLAPIAFVCGGILRACFKRDFHILYFFSVSLVLLLAIYQFPFESVEVWIDKLPLFHGNPPIHQTTFFQFFVFVTAALGLQYLWETDFSNKPFLKVVVLFAAFFLTLMAIREFQLLMTEGQPSVYLFSYYRTSIYLTAALLIVFVAIVLKGAFIRKYSNYLLSLLVVLFFYEAKVHSAGWAPSMKAQAWFPATETTDFLKANLGESRVMPLDRAAVPETLSEYGFPVPVGRGSVPRPLMFFLFDVYKDAYRHPTQTLFPSSETDLSGKIWDLMDVKYFVAPRDVSADRFEKYGDKVELIRLKDSTIVKKQTSPAYAFIVSDGVIVEKQEDLTSWFNKPEWNLRSNFILEDGRHLLNGDSEGMDVIDGSRAGQIKNVKQETNSIKIKANIKNPAYLVLSQYYYPGWKAYVNGEETEIFRAYHFLSAIALPKVGQLKIEFKYRPNSIKYGLIISLVGFLFSAIFFFLMIRRERQ